MPMVSIYINYLRRLKKRRLKKTDQVGRLAIEITLILVIKVILLWLLWAMFFAHPIAKDARQLAVTRIILDQSN